VDRLGSKSRGEVLIKNASHTDTLIRGMCAEDNRPPCGP
jgi:hypothetical protein